VFNPARILDVRIEVDPGDWDKIRMEGRTFEDILGGATCLGQPFPSVFNYYRGTVTIDGETVGDVGVRKKGFLGSLSETKPSLKVKFHEYLPEQTWSGMKRLTLNNGRQDPSLIRQCLGYAVFGNAGIPAARCNYAVVTVNGQRLGVYTHVESMKKPFIRRHFDDDTGNFYEGTLSDFRPEWIHTFERKTNRADEDRSDLDGVMAAAEASDSTLLAELDKVITLDPFMTFWAAETLIAHWDGYSGNTNNYYIYAEPQDGRFTFIPWGIDAVFGRAGDPNDPRNVQAQGVITRRLYDHPEGRQRYIESMRELLDGVWEERTLRDEAARMEALIMPEVDNAEQRTVRGAIAQVRDFIATRRGILERELTSPMELRGPLRDPPCFIEAGTLDLEFSTTFGTHPAPNPFITGTSTLTLTDDNGGLPTQAFGASSGWGEGDDAGQTVVLGIATVATGGFAVAYLVVNPALLQPGTKPIDGVQVRGVLMRIPRAGAQAQLIGWYAGGELELDEAAATPGAAIKGRYRVNLLSPP